MNASQLREMAALAEHTERAQSILMPNASYGQGYHDGKADAMRDLITVIDKAEAKANADEHAGVAIYDTANRKWRAVCSLGDWRGEQTFDTANAAVKDSYYAHTLRKTGAAVEGTVTQEGNHR